MRVVVPGAHRLSTSAKNDSRCSAPKVASVARWFVRCRMKRSNIAACWVIEREENGRRSAPAASNDCHSRYASTGCSSHLEKVFISILYTELASSARTANLRFASWSISGRGGLAPVVCRNRFQSGGHDSRMSVRRDKLERIRLLLDGGHGRRGRRIAYDDRDHRRHDRFARRILRRVFGRRTHLRHGSAGGCRLAALFLAVVVREPRSC